VRVDRRGTTLTFFLSLLRRERKEDGNGSGRNQAEKDFRIRVS
jgi:hypothetical protein